MIGEALKTSLRRTYRTDWVSDGDAAVEALGTHAYDVVLLDLGLPKTPGLDVLRKLRQRDAATMVLIMTARDAVSDRVAGLDAGADDYLVKPFELDELDARIRALLRRQGTKTAARTELGTLAIDHAAREVTFDGEAIALTNKEYALLLTLSRKPGIVFSVGELEEHLYGWNEEVESNAVEFLVYQLRRKLSKDLIRNVRGQGYKLVVP